MVPALLEILALIVIRTAPWVPYIRLYSSLSHCNSTISHRCCRTLINLLITCFHISATTDGEQHYERFVAAEQRRISSEASVKFGIKSWVQKKEA